jgi:hypothetical protein
MIEKVLRASIVPILSMLAILDCSSRPADEDPTCAGFADRMCRREQACSHVSFDTSWGDIAVCKQATIRHCRQRIEALGSHETREGIADCARALSERSCEPELPPACIPPAGDLPDDASCRFDGQCKGRMCLPSAAHDCGRCVAMGRLGDACGASVPCAGTYECREGICHSPPIAEDGEACGGSKPICRWPLICRGANHGQEGICSSPLAKGERCIQDIPNECDYSKGLSCSGAETCEEAPILPGPGAPCRDGQCNGSAMCDDRQMCVPRPREGQPCQFECLLPAICRTVTTSAGEERRMCTVPEPSCP